jgi:hypothetical protein
MTESDVKKEVRRYLISREGGSPPVVVWFDRLNSGQIHNGNQHIYLCQDGTADFLCLFIGKKKQLCALFIETKSTDEKQEPRKGAQTEFRNKYHQRHVDMYYMIAQSKKDVSDAINRLAYDFVAEIEYP